MGRKPKAAFDAIVVGAGFAGLYMLHRLRGLGLTARVYEAGDGVGGTWYWNRYPGARCDVESLDYSYSFSDELQQEWRWSERYAAQPEILAYANHVADRFDLRRDVQLNTRVTAAHFDEKTHRWNVETASAVHRTASADRGIASAVRRTDQGDRAAAPFLVFATGCLSASRLPDIPGLDTFAGATYHTGRWPHEGVDFTGLRVGVIGTGSSAIQSIPIIAAQAAHLHVFQRTPNYSVPAHNGPLDPEHERRVKAEYAEFRRQARESRAGFVVERGETPALEAAPEEREREFEKRWRRGGFGLTSAFADLMTDRAANETVAEFVRGKIRAIVRDGAVADALCPRDYPLGTKRLCVDTGYYETFNRDNVSLVDLRRTPIEAITPDGVRTTDTTFALDAIVFATGFDAMTGALLNVDVRGRGGLTLREAWATGPRSHLGLAVHGFPNMFTITGPGSPSVLSNMLVSIEQHVDWVADCLAHLRAHDVAAIEPTAEAQDAWCAQVDEVGHTTLYPLANSWYMGANVPGKPRVFMPYVGGVGKYRQICDEVAAKGYEGFDLTRQEVHR